jgi:hypothetical protein
LPAAGGEPLKENLPLDAVNVPLGYPCSLIYTDESGSPGIGKMFVVGAVKIRESGRLQRAIRDIRDRRVFTGEFKFRAITKGALLAYYDLIDELESSDAHLAACVVDPNIHDPSSGGSEAWTVHAQVAAQLIRGVINKRELVSVLMDGISTPRNVAYDDVVRGMVNNHLGATAVVTAACGDSRWNDGLQVADLVAGAVAAQRRTVSAPLGSPKGKVAQRLATAFGLNSFADVRVDRVRIQTYRTGRAKPILTVVKNTRRVS